MKPAITYLDAGPDSQGRRFFVVDWEDPGGIFRPEPHPADGEPVGYRRGQVFHTDPQNILNRWSVQ